ncbi:MAG TPA: DEAD/DEAH box helicase [Elainellaceae cyanobacterium]
MAKKYRFSWDAFDDRVVTAIAITDGYSSLFGSDPRTWLTTTCSCPDESFIQRMKATLEQSWLPNYPGTPHIVEQLLDAGIGPMGSPKTQQDYVTYIRKCRNSKTLRLCLLDAVLRYGDPDRQPDDHGVSVSTSRVSQFAILEPTNQAIDSRQPHDYQVEAWNKLSAHLAESEVTHVFQGLLVMPTGAGKTFTTVRWLFQNIINRGDRVVWLAHRHELLEQAAREFHALAGLATRIEKLRVRIVSGIHCSSAQIDPADHILIASVSSLSRRPDLISGILADPATFLVIDEAHHSSTKSYMSLISCLSTGDRRILGLTATPTRTSERERGTLAAMFGHRILYEIPIKTLIERQFLSRPLPVHVSTHTHVEAGISLDDEKHLARFNELSEDWLERIANIQERNHLIVSHYLENTQKYGKTLIFAINVLHADLLTERLKDAGVKAEYIASDRLDENRINNQDVIRRFRSKDHDSSIDVLVNVQILTEGIDIPTIQTVFLTRPTISEILMRQMVGRALRGEKAGGTKDAYVVSFEDHWERFREWQSPLTLVPDIVPLESKKSIEPDTSDTPDAADTSGNANNIELPDLLEVLPWDLIHTTAAQILDNGRYDVDVFEAVPQGWYILSREHEDEDIYQVIAVYEHQHPSWDALLNQLWALPKADLDCIQIDATFDEFFCDCDHPLPSQYEVQKVIEHLLAGGDRPEYNRLQERERCDPYRIADHILMEDLGAKAQTRLINDCYTDLAKAIYPGLRDFRAAIDDALYERQHPEEVTRFHRAIPIFAPRPDEMLQPGPYHNLERLMAEVIEQIPVLLGLNASLLHRSTISWTTRLVKGWYGHARWESGQSNGYGSIRINRLLDSPDVSGDVIRYLIWHEYLHLYLQQGHTNTFRNYERRWPTYQECDRFLNNLNERFGVQFW